MANIKSRLNKLSRAIKKKGDDPCYCRMNCLVRNLSDPDERCPGCGGEVFIFRTESNLDGLGRNDRALSERLGKAQISLLMDLHRQWNMEHFGKY